MPADPRLLFLPPLRKRAEELAQERCAYRVVALGWHPWANQPEWLRAQDIDTEAHLLADLSRPASRRELMDAVATAHDVDGTHGLTLGCFPCGEHCCDGDTGEMQPCGRRLWSLMGLYPEAMVEFADCPNPEHWSGEERIHVPGISSVTDPAEALALITIATLGASDV